MPGNMVGKYYLSGDTVFILDLIRVIACEMVAFSHILSLYSAHNHLANDASNPIWVIDTFLGYTGVTMFFFMSGIVISNSLIKKNAGGNYSFLKYFIDRFSRIYSGLIPCIIIILAGGWLLFYINPEYYNTMQIWQGRTDILTIIANLLMIQHFPVLNFPTISYGDPLWSLNIEWWLYLLFGWLVFKYHDLVGMKLKSIIIFAIFGFWPILEFLVGPENLVFVWALGVFITILLVSYGEKFRDNIKYVSLAIGTLLLIRSAYLFWKSTSFYDLTFELLLGTFILTLVIYFNGRTIIHYDRMKSLIGLIARFSFTLYLVHLIIQNIVYAIDLTYGLNLSMIILAPIMMIVANVVSLVIAYFTEMRYKSVARWLHAKLEQRAGVVQGVTG
jgi:peptidoglycan/LPS O-acetylase OafA/YrhL